MAKGLVVKNKVMLRLILLVYVMVLSGCASWMKTAAPLAEVSGRFSVQYLLDGTPGHKQASFTLERGQDYRIFTVNAALGVAVMQIRYRKDKVTLVLSDGKKASAPTFAQLGSKFTPYMPLPPLPNFFDWLEGRGLTQQGKSFTVATDNAHYLTASGWDIRYQNWLSQKPKIALLYQNPETYNYVKIRAVITK